MWVKGVNVVEENCLVSSRGPSRQPSVCNPLTAVCERTGLGSSLGAGEGNTGVVVFCADATCGTEDFETLVRGVGRTGVPPTIHDFCLAPPKSVFKVALEESTSRSLKTGWPSLSGGRRISQQNIRVDIGIEVIEDTIVPERLTDQCCRSVRQGCASVCCCLSFDTRAGRARGVIRVRRICVVKY